MGFFDDDNDPFEGILREFFGENSRTKNYKEKILSSEEDENTIDYVEDGKKVYFVFELSGYNEGDVQVIIREGFIEIKAKKNNKEAELIKEYLNQKLGKGVLIKKRLPKFVNIKKISHTMRNGVLEVAFDKK